MTHEEIRAAVERLRELTACSNEIMKSNIIGAIFGYISRDDACDRFIELLEQADPDVHMELPVDADSVPIHIGDELISKHSKKKFIVTRLQYSRKHAWMVGGADKDDLSKYGLYAPRETRHYQPTVEDVLREYASIVIGVGDGPELDDVLSECAGRIREVMADD